MSHSSSEGEWGRRKRDGSADYASRAKGCHTPIAFPSPPRRGAEEEKEGSKVDAVLCGWFQSAFCLGKRDRHQKRFELSFLLFFLHLFFFFSHDDVAIIMDDEQRPKKFENASDSSRRRRRRSRMFEKTNAEEEEGQSFWCRYKKTDRRDWVARVLGKRERERREEKKAKNSSRRLFARERSLSVISRVPRSFPRLSRFF